MQRSMRFQFILVLLGRTVRLGVAHAPDDFHVVGYRGHWYRQFERGSTTLKICAIFWSTVCDTARMVHDGSTRSGWAGVLVPVTLWSGDWGHHPINLSGFGLGRLRGRLGRSFRDCFLIANAVEHGSTGPQDHLERLLANSAGNHGEERRHERTQASALGPI